MSRRYRFHVSLVVLVGISACGSRSGLSSAGGGASGGASSGGAATGATGGTSTGGSVSTARCSSLVLVEPVITPDPLPTAALDDILRLTPTSDDGQRVTAVFLRKNPTGKFGLRHATLRPWESWPKNGELAPILSPGIETESSHQIGRSAGGLWATVVRGALAPELHRNLDPLGGGAGGLVTTLPGIAPVFVSHSTAVAHLVGTFDSTPAGNLLRATQVDSSGKPTELPPLGCGSGQAPRAGAVAFADRWLVALSRFSPSAACPNPKALSPMHVDVLDVVDGGYKSLATASVGAKIIDLQIAPHPSGAFVVWGVSGNASHLYAMRVRSDAGLVVGPVAVPPASASLTSFSIGAVGNQLVVARRKGFALDIAVFNESLAKVTDVVLPVSSPPRALSVYGAPGGDGVLVGWTENVSGDFSVHLARFDCVQ